MYIHTKRGFTLVELLIVIGILVILTAAVIVILNPAELLRQARDSKRMQDLASLQQTINMLIMEDPGILDGISTTTIYASLPNTDCPPFPYSCRPAQDLQKTDGTGWIPISFGSQTGNIPVLPIDPVNTSSSGLYYLIVLGDGRFELNAVLDSQKYQPFSQDDGGNSTTTYERGTYLNFIP